MNKIAIIGAGASGLLASIIAKRLNSSLKITIFEKNDNAGKKILASGNGRCNITNENLSIKNYFGMNPDFVKFALNEFGFSRFKKFSEELGLILDIKEDGKCYPLTNEAKTVTTLLENEARKFGICFELGHEIKEIKKEKKSFLVNGLKFDKVLIASGLGAAPQLGSNESGLGFAKNLGHSINLLYPVLVGLELDGEIHSKMFGVKMNSEISFYINGTFEEKATGDILFTKYGISGFGILDISTSASYALSILSEVEISLNLLPKFDRQQLFTLLKRLSKNEAPKPIQEILIGILPAKVIPFVAGKDIKSTVNNIQNLRFKVTSTHGFRHAEASGGGVDTTEVDDKTMESKKVKNLYFAGEVLDVVGQRGGYNFAWAWASGYLAGKSLAQ